MVRRAICTLCAATCFAATAGATTIARMTLRQLATASEVVVRARCLSSDSRWQGGEIWTLSRFATLETYKGSPPAEFTVRLIGGQVGGIESIVAGVPRFWPGEEAVLFLDPVAGGGYSVTAWEEGTFRVTRDAAGRRFVTQNMAAEEIYDPGTRRFRGESVRRMPLSEFRRKIRSIAAPKAGHEQSDSSAPRFGRRARGRPGQGQRAPAMRSESAEARRTGRAPVFAAADGGLP